MTKRRKSLAPVITLVPKPKSSPKLRLLAALHEMWERADAGEIDGLVMAVRTPDAYEYLRVNVGLTEAIGLVDRQRVMLHKDWDERFSGTPPA